MRSLRNPKFSLTAEEKCCAEKAKVRPRAESLSESWRTISAAEEGQVVRLRHQTQLPVQRRQVFRRQVQQRRERGSVQGQRGVEHAAGQRVQAQQSI